MAHSPVILLGLQLLNAILLAFWAASGCSISGSDARSGGFSHHALYQHVARGLDHRRISGGHRRRDLELSRCVLVCDGDDYRHSVCLLRIKDV